MQYAKLCANGTLAIEKLRKLPEGQGTSLPTTAVKRPVVAALLLDPDLEADSSIVGNDILASGAVGGKRGGVRLIALPEATMGTPLIITHLELLPYLLPRTIYLSLNPCNLPLLICLNVWPIV